MREMIILTFLHNIILCVFVITCNLLTYLVFIIASQLTFSEIKHILNNRRSNLHKNMVKSILYMKDWLMSNLSYKIILLKIFLMGSRI